MGEGVEMRMFIHLGDINGGGIRQSIVGWVEIDYDRFPAEKRQQIGHSGAVSCFPTSRRTHHNLAPRHDDDHTTE